MKWSFTSFHLRCIFRYLRALDRLNKWISTAYDSYFPLLVNTKLSFKLIWPETSLFIDSAWKHFVNILYEVILFQFIKTQRASSSSMKIEIYIFLCEKTFSLCPQTYNKSLSTEMKLDSVFLKERLMIGPCLLPHNFICLFTSLISTKCD